MYCKKFPFFDEENYEDITQENLLNNLQSYQMYAIDQIVFISGKYKKKSTTHNNAYQTEPCILKIFKNKIIDEYKPFNKLIHFFNFITYENKHYFICCGMDFNLPTNPSMMDNMIHFMTSIKIYNAEKFIDKNHVVGNSNINNEYYLIKQINLLRYIDDPNQYFIGKDLPKGVETINNIISFGISDDLRYISFGMDHGSIVLIKGYPYIFNALDKNIKIKNLEPIDTDLHITNLCFTQYRDIGHENVILYASTTKQLFFYKINEKEETLYLLNQDSGAYSNCIFPKNEKLVVATSMDNQIIEYENLEMRRSNFFEGKKQIANYFKNLITFVTIEDKQSILSIFDGGIKFFSYHNSSFSKVCNICSEGDFIYCFVEINSQKKVIKLKEKDSKYKFEIFYRRSFFDTALEYANSLNYSDEKISEIHQRHGDHVYMKGDYNKAIEEYIFTINYLDPSYVIQKFLDGSKLDYLIKYLEALHKENAFKFRCHKEMKDYTALLLNCYIKQKQIIKLKEFVDGKEISAQLINVETAIQVCKDTDQIDLALNIAEKSSMFEAYIQLMIDKKSKYFN